MKPPARLSIPARYSKETHHVPFWARLCSNAFDVNSIEARQVRRARLAFELLEARELLAWTPLADLPVPITSLAAAVGGDGQLYVIGQPVIGISATTRSPIMQAYNPGTKVWLRGCGPAVPEHWQSLQRSCGSNRVRRSRLRAGN